MQDERQMIFLLTDNVGLSAARQLGGEWDHRLRTIGGRLDIGLILIILRMTKYPEGCRKKAALKYENYERKYPHVVKQLRRGLDLYLRHTRVFWAGRTK